MDPQINTSPGQSQINTTGGTDTFTEQIASEASVTPDAFAQNQVATNQHNRRLIYYIVWGALVVFLLLAVGGGSYVLWLNRQGIARDLGINNLFNPTNIELPNNSNLTVGNGNGLLTVNGSEQINGDLTVTGNTNIGGTVTANAFVGDGSQLTNIQSTLPAFVAFTNKNNQLFFGTNQLFRNASDTTTALQVQQANGNPVFTVDTTDNKGNFSNGLEVGNIANLQGSIFNDPFFGIGGNIYKSLAVARELTNNQPGVTYTSSGTEFLINPQNDPVSGGNLFAASYSGAKIATGNTQNFITVAGSLSSLVHAGSGTVQQAVGQVNVVGNDGPGTIAIAANGSFTTTLSSSGNILAATGALTLNPSILPGATGIIGVNSGLTAGNCQTFINLKNFLGIIPPTCVGSQYSPNIVQQVGLSVLSQDAAGCTVFNNPTVCPGQTTPVNVNIYSEGNNSTNFFEGSVGVGVCSPILVSLLDGCSPVAGPKLIVNTPVGGATAIPLDVVTQVYSNSATDQPLLVRGFTGQSADLTQWQNSAGTVLDRITSTGAVSIGSGAPTNKLSVVDTSDDTPANFTGTSGTCTVDTFGGGWSCVSDEKLKTNIMSIDGGLDKVLALRGVTYNWKADPNATQAVSGFIAQEVQKVLPGLVTTLNDGTLSLNKDGMLPYLVEAVKTENGKIDDINTKLSDQGIKLDSLSAEFKTLSDQVADHEARLKSLETQSATDTARIDALEKKLNQSQSSSTPTSTTP